MENTFFISRINQIYTVKLLWSIGQPFVCGTLEEVVKYSLHPNNGIDAFYELNNNSIKKVSKKELKSLLNRQNLTELSNELFKKY
jgi:hypothetical protein